ncbi:MAG: polymer-forming cytoskeletal protein [Pseudomonadota bacterium]
MFGRKKRSTSRIETLIAAGTRIEGNLFVSGGVHLEGTVVGNVTAEQGAPAVLSIAAKGLVEGCVDVPRVIVHGEVRGDIRAQDRVELGPTAKVSGDLSYGVIEMAAGAVIQGRLVSLAGTTASGA